MINSEHNQSSPFSFLMVHHECHVNGVYSTVQLSVTQVSLQVLLICCDEISVVNEFAVMLPDFLSCFQICCCVFRAVVRLQISLLCFRICCLVSEIDENFYSIF